MTKDELLEIPAIARGIDRARDHIAELRELAESAGAVDTTIERVTRSDARRAMAIADKIIDLDREIREEEELLEQLTAAARGLFSCNLDGLEQEVMMRRYCDHLAWESVSTVVGYDMRYVFRIHKAALARLFDHVRPCN